MIYNPTPKSSPGGSNTDVQFNNNGVFGGSNNLTWNGSTLTVKNHLEVQDIDDYNGKSWLNIDNSGNITIGDISSSYSGNLIGTNTTGIILQTNAGNYVYSYSDFRVSDTVNPFFNVDIITGLVNVNSTGNAGAPDASFVVGSNPFSSDPTTGSFRVFGPNYAKQSWYSVNGITDNRKWQLYAGPSGQFHLGLLNDAENSEQFMFEFTSSSFTVGPLLVLSSDIYSSFLNSNMTTGSKDGFISIGDVGNLFSGGQLQLNQGLGDAHFAGFNSITGDQGISGNILPIGNTQLTAIVQDASASAGTSGQILSSTGSATAWINNTPNYTAQGSTTLVSGTKAITISGLTTSNRAFAQLVTTGGTLGNGYKAVCTTNTLTITSVVAAGTTQTLDTSTLNYLVL